MFQSEILRVCEGYLDLLPTVDGRYKLVKDIGISRFGKVHLAVDLKQGRLVAIKSLIHWQHEESHLRMFLNELGNLVKIRKAGKGARVCNLLDFNFRGRYSGGRSIVYYVMQYKEMGDLFTLVETLDEHVSTKLAGFFHHQICLALSDVHQAGLAHLDLKPDNIVLDEDLNVFLCDFGHSLDTSDRLITRTRKNKFLHPRHVEELASTSFVGSAQYCAPEVHDFQALLREPAPDSARVPQAVQSIDFGKCDVFSAGVVLFVQLHQTFPFNKAHADDLHFRTMMKKPQIYWKSFKNVRVVDQGFRDFFYESCETINAKRASLKQVLGHPWLQDHRYCSGEEAKEEMKQWLRLKKQLFIKELLENFKDQRRVRKVAIFLGNEVVDFR